MTPEKVKAAHAELAKLPLNEWETTQTLNNDSEYDSTVEVQTELHGVTWSAIGMVSCGDLIDIDDDTFEIVNND